VKIGQSEPDLQPNQKFATGPLPQLDAGMLLYDPFYRWCRDATEETHNWPVRKGA